MEEINQRVGLADGLEGLASSISEADISRSLEGIASQYGRVVCINALPLFIRADKSVATFLIDFETTVDALLASREMHCPLFGFRTVIVSVPRNGAGSTGRINYQAPAADYAYENSWRSA